MQKSIPTLLLLFLSVTLLFGQNLNKESRLDSIKILKGRIIDVNDKTPLQSAHIVNLTHC